MGEDPEPRKPGDDDWIDKVVRWTTALGMNPTRTRWKLIRWQENRRKARRRLDQKLDHIRYEHKTCPSCGAVQDRDAVNCSRCEAKLGGHRVHALRRIGLAMPDAVSMSTLLVLAFIGVYVRMLIASGAGLASPSVDLLYQFGGHWPPAVHDEPWRLVTSIFLHFTLWHLGFNVIAIAMIGSQVEQLYGRLTILFVFVTTGIVANLGSNAMGLEGIGIGASGGVMGLIGTAIGHGHRLGTSYGRALRNDMLKWTAYTFVFGYFIGADNWAHFFGGLAGAVFGYAVEPRKWSVPALMPLRAAIKLVGVILVVGALVVIFTRTPSATNSLTRPSFGFGPYAKVCRSFYAGDVAGAQAGLREVLSKTGQAEPDIGEMCDHFLVERELCRRSVRPDYLTADRCTLVEEAFGEFSQQPQAPLPP